MTALLVTTFLASLAGSLHCAGMCGPFAAFWSDPAGDRPGRLASAAAYHAARLATYATLGALAGLAGGVVDSALAPRLRAGAALAAGLLLVTWGCVGLLRHAGVSLPRLPLPSGLGRLLARTSSAARAWPPLRRAAALGLLTTLLPCGWLHAFVLAAAGTASPLRGALLMAAFWAGTLPALAAVGAGAFAILGPLRRHAPAVSAALVLIAGIATLAHHARSLSTPEPCHEEAAAAVAGITR